MRRKLGISPGSRGQDDRKVFERGVALDLLDQVGSKTRAGNADPLAMDDRKVEALRVGLEHFPSLIRARRSKQRHALDDERLSRGVCRINVRIQKKNLHLTSLRSFCRIS